jgi:hypothetical protein
MLRGGLRGSARPSHQEAAQTFAQAASRSDYRAGRMPHRQTPFTALTSAALLKRGLETPGDAVRARRHCRRRRLARPAPTAG